MILDSGERDVAYCVNPGRNLASKKPDGDEWAEVILIDLWTNVHIPFGSKFELVLEHDVLWHVIGFKSQKAHVCKAISPPKKKLNLFSM